MTLDSHKALPLARAIVLIASGAMLATPSAAQHAKKKPAKSAATHAAHKAAPTAVKPVPAAGSGPAPEVITLARKVYDSNGCGACHVIAGKGGAVGPDLSATGADATHTAAWFVVQINNPKAHTPTSSMPGYAGKLKPNELTSLASYLTTLKPTASAPTVGAIAVIKVPPPNPAIVAKIEKSGGTVREVAQSDQRLEVDYHMQAAGVTDAALAPLDSMKSVVYLNLARTPVTDAGLAHVAHLTDLMELHLEGTKVTDRGLAHIKGLRNLTYLNLYDTGITDVGLADLTGLTKLKSLYLWHTKVTKEGVDKLKAALPKLDIVLGFDQDLKK